MSVILKSGGKGAEGGHSWQINKLFKGILPDYTYPFARIFVQILSAFWVLHFFFGGGHNASLPSTSYAYDLTQLLKVCFTLTQFGSNLTEAFLACSVPIFL